MDILERGVDDDGEMQRRGLCAFRGASAALGGRGAKAVEVLVAGRWRWRWRWRWVLLCEIHRRRMLEVAPMVSFRRPLLRFVVKVNEQLNQLWWNG